jgi:hypothetical protein
MRLVGDMPRKPLELPPAVARNFVRDMRAFFAGKDGIKKDGIAAGTLHMLKHPYPGKLRLTDAREMFVQMRNEL